MNFEETKRVKPEKEKKVAMKRVGSKVIQEDTTSHEALDRGKPLCETEQDGTGRVLESPKDVLGRIP